MQLVSQFVSQLVSSFVSQLVSQLVSFVSFVSQLVQLVSSFVSWLVSWLVCSFVRQFSQLVSFRFVSFGSFVRQIVSSFVSRVMDREQTWWVPESPPSCFFAPSCNIRTCSTHVARVSLDADALRICVYALACTHASILGVFTVVLIRLVGLVALFAFLRNRAAWPYAAYSLMLVYVSLHFC